MKTTILGRSGLEVSRIAFGTWQLGGEWGQFDENTAVAAIRRARELGVNFFDTAQHTASALPRPFSARRCVTNSAATATSS
jgi:diketogulonate reductase-like aldo/keto reductase